MNQNIVIISSALLLLVLVPLAQATLTIYSPKKLINEFRGQPIQYSIANFGHIPYGKTMIGSLVLADPITACSPLKAFNGTESPFVLALRGNCTFVTKVKYAQLVGAKGVIIMDDQEEYSENITMADDGHAFSLKIPSILIEKRDGEKLIQYINSTIPEEKNVEINLKFDTQTFSHINYTFWITTSSRQSFKLIRDFKKHYLKLKDHATFTPHYAIWTCHICQVQNFTQPTPENCISGGRYCCPDPDGFGPASGRDVVQEDLRQLCLFKDNQEKWWSYMNRFDKECINAVVLDECSKMIMTDIQANIQNVDKCVKNSYETKAGQNPNILNDDNTVLKEERNAFIQKGVLFWPSITINNVTYRGNLEADDIFEAICTSYDSPPEQCYNVLGIQKDNGPNVTLIILLVLLVLVIFFVFMIFVYKKMVKKELQKEMSGQVNQMVSQYIAFYESREKKKEENI